MTEADLEFMVPEDMKEIDKLINDEAVRQMEKNSEGRKEGSTRD